MKRLVWIFTVFILPQISNSAQILHTEVYPKPVKAGQEVHFRITLDERISLEVLENRLQIAVNGRILPTDFVGALEKTDGEMDVFLRGIAPEDFDWRSVRPRWDGVDYPPGPDDPYMICDAPFRVKSANAPLPISIAFHDGSEDDVQLQYVEAFNDVTGELVNSYPVWEWISDSFHSYLFNDLSATNFNCIAGDTAWIKVVLHCDDHDWPFIPEEYTFTQHLKVRVGRDLPVFPGWYYGDLHFHSKYTDNLYEYGGPVEMIAAASEAIGLQFATISDHSCDFDANGVLWAQMAADCQTYSNDAVHLFPSEEVTLDDNEENNSTENRIHFLNYGNFFIRGPEAPLTFTMDTSDQFTYLSEALSLLEAGGGYGYAAHPFDPLDPFAALFGIALMSWSDDNFDIARTSSAFAGMELWNSRDRYFKNVDYWYELNPFPWQENSDWQSQIDRLYEGLEYFDTFLSLGLTQNLITPTLLPQKLFIAAGSDAHGDFNYRTYNSNPVFFDVYATDNAFGNLRTAVYVPGYNPGQLPLLDEMMTALRLGRSMITDGPFIELGIDVNGDSDLVDAEDLIIGEDNVLFTNQADSAKLIIRWNSTADWGTVAAVLLHGGTSTTGANPDLLWSTAPNTYSGEQIMPLTSLISAPTSGWIYLRAEVTGALLPDGARRAFTNPIWLRLDTTPLASVSLVPQEELILIPESGGSFEYTISITNHQTSPVTGTVWMDIVLPNGLEYPLLNVVLTIPAGATISRVRTQLIPAGARAGDYVYRAFVGAYPALWSSDGFAFSKLGVGTGVDQTNWGIIEESQPTGIGLVQTETANKTVSVTPNPFNATTVFSFDLPETAWIELKIYNLCGREVAVLQEGWGLAGQQSFSWNANSLAAGVYFYRLKVDSETCSGKLVLLK
ncbi:MAG: T9SS type A sorting domain-containing protein [bacterium]